MIRKIQWDDHDEKLIEFDAKDPIGEIYGPAVNYHQHEAGGFKPRTLRK